MCELGVFPIFLENDLLKVDKILGLTFFKARKDLNARGRRHLTSSNRAAIFVVTSCEERHNKPI